jgi:multidrug transporter EmrE-like cation transporter
MSFPIVYLYILLIVVFETAAMTCFKRSLDNSAFFAIGLLFYACVGFLLCQTYKHSGLAMTNAVWSGISVGATTIVGVMLFKEVLHLHDYFAILLISSGVLILNVTD